MVWWHEIFLSLMQLRVRIKFLIWELTEHFQFYCLCIPWKEKQNTYLSFHLEIFNYFNSTVWLLIFAVNHNITSYLRVCFLQHNMLLHRVWLVSNNISAKSQCWMEDETSAPSSAPPAWMEEWASGMSRYHTHTHILQITHATLMWPNVCLCDTLLTWCILRHDMNIVFEHVTLFFFFRLWNLQWRTWR